MRENNCWLLFSLLYKCKLYKMTEDVEEETKEVSMTEDGEEETKEVSFFSENRRILHIVDYNETYKEAIDHINELMQTYVIEKSGWKMYSIEAIKLNITI